MTEATRYQTIAMSVPAHLAHPILKLVYSDYWDEGVPVQLAPAGKRSAKLETLSFCLPLHHVNEVVRTVNAYVRNHLWAQQAVEEGLGKRERIEPPPFPPKSRPPEPKPKPEPEPKPAEPEPEQTPSPLPTSWDGVPIDRNFAVQASMAAVRVKREHAVRAALTQHGIASVADLTDATAPAFVLTLSQEGNDILDETAARIRGGAGDE